MLSNLHFLSINIDCQFTIWYHLTKVNRIWPFYLYIMQKKNNSYVRTGSTLCIPVIEKVCRHFVQNFWKVTTFHLKIINILHMLREKIALVLPCVELNIINTAKIPAATENNMAKISNSFRPPYKKCSLGVRPGWDLSTLASSDTVHKFT